MCDPAVMHPRLLSSFAAIGLIAIPAVARAQDDGDDSDAKRAALVDKLLDTDVGDGPKFFAFDEMCGMDCETTAWGGCRTDGDKVECEVRVSDRGKKPAVIAAHDAGNDTDGLAAAHAKLLAAFKDAGYGSIWLEEHRFDTPAEDLTAGEYTFRWDWKKKTLTVKRGKYTKKVKAPALRKGLGVTSAAVWFKVGEQDVAGIAVLRVHGEDDTGGSGDATALVPLP
jgi:hypothetical protein